ncbi:hypothetical protein C0J52_00780 [Blattella germanica]|nr:hypothetical protein C0J52_00780 [Blattella germanica]
MFLAAERNIRHRCSIPGFIKVRDRKQLFTGISETKHCDHFRSIERHCLMITFPPFRFLHYSRIRKQSELAIDYKQHTVHQTID